MGSVDSARLSTRYNARSHDLSSSSFLLMPAALASAAIALVCGSLATCVWLATRPRSSSSTPPAFIVTNSVYHRRNIPDTAQHAFKYTTRSLLVSLRHLEARSLDLGHGRLFGYGLRPALRITGISPADYLTRLSVGTTFDPVVMSIQSRLRDLIRTRLGDEVASTCCEDVWMHTMPTYLGMEMNPLTVYFCYDSQNGACVVTVLEVHSTFAERHAYVLVTGEASSQQAAGSGFEHAWVIPKQFHVSPFSARDGFYECHINPPSPSPSSVASGAALDCLPYVRLHLLTSEDTPRIRLVALQRGVVAQSLTSSNLGRTIAAEPFTWLLTFARILYQAYILHYLRRLDVYLRPEPHGLSNREVEMRQGRNGVQVVKQPEPTLYWLEPGGVDRLARGLFEQFLDQRAKEVGMEVTLAPTNPFEATKTIGPSDGASGKLTIYFRSWEAFVFILEAPTPQLALALSRAQFQPLFTVSSERSFIQLLQPASEASPSRRGQQLARFFRRQLLPEVLHDTCRAQGNALESINPWLAARILFWRVLVAHLEHGAFSLLKARTVPGNEPWLQWQRAAQIHATDEDTSASE